MDTNDVDVPAAVRPAARAALPALLAGVTWLLVLVAVGIVGRTGSPSLVVLVPLFVVALMAWPIAGIRPWRDGLQWRLEVWVRSNRSTIGVGVALLVGFALGLVPSPLSALLGLPFRAAGLLYPVRIFYATAVDPVVGDAVFRAALWYLAALWSLAIAHVGLGVVRRLR